MVNINSKTFGYCRVSSTDQKEDRQLEAMLELGINERDIFVDKCSGKNFDRPQYQALKVQLREGDILVIAVDFIKQRFQRTLKVAFGKRNFMKFHELRGSCATILHKKGVPTKVIQKLLRHGRASVKEHTK